TIVIVHEPAVELYYVLCLETAISGPRLIRAWKRRHWIEYCFRTLKHLLATGAYQLHNEDAYYGHLILRLMGCLVLFYTSRMVCKRRLTMEIGFKQLTSLVRRGAPGSCQSSLRSVDTGAFLRIRLASAVAG